MGKMRESYSKKGFGALASKAERGLQEKIFSVVNPNELAKNSSDIRLITTQSSKRLNTNDPEVAQSQIK